MSCSSIKHRFEEERQRGLSFERAMEMYRELEGSLAAHRLELEDLKRTNADPDRISHLQAHINDGEKLLKEMKQLHLH
ncbi:hypothetical protein SAMN02745218_01837 [Desulfofundulus australicus DSM 11792]|uniref:Uncharacterized protein n=1 Tax=Desulfofundulus australicus DSM 11792 TaxID=1121425 RepID=A0A1M5A981_9FIRM|nr:hypothetical protein [Desulfofundulus australicus]MDK2888918.1 hypothetical protein [Thermoanaerobacter sp.]SHF26871.1 hypothetical protein SAMN02745218_01837 [Desulfofundulus australicus DSM 11792]